MSDPLPASLAEAARRILRTADPAAKVELTRAFAAAWRDGLLAATGTAAPPDRPARPDRPDLLPARAMPRRSKGGLAGRVALLHAIAHIELNAIDLAWDIAARFPDAGMPRAFLDDWVGVADDEARHFRLLADRMAELGAAYGDLPAHDGLWEAAETTADDLAARLALVPMTLEARGLDTTPPTAARLRVNGDARSAAILEDIAGDEVSHVAAGVRWFEFLMARQGRDCRAAFAELLATRFRGRLKAPFDHAARERAGMARDYYDPAGPITG